MTSARDVRRCGIAVSIPDATVITFNFQAILDFQASTGSVRSDRRRQCAPDHVASLSNKYADGMPTWSTVERAYFLCIPLGVHSVLKTRRGRLFAAKAKKPRSLMLSMAEQMKQAGRHLAGAPLTLVAYHRLLDMIMSGELRTGAVVQERRLAKALNISRTPLREALFRLEGEGLLIRQQEGVLQVKSVTLQDYRDAMRVRMVIECEAARLAAGNMPASRIAAIRSRIEAVLRTVEAQGSPVREELDDVDDAVHHAVADASDNPLLAELIRTVRRRSRLFGLEHRPARLRATCAEHGAILDAIAAGDCKAAAETMSHHLQHIMDDLRNRLFDPLGTRQLSSNPIGHAPTNASFGT